MKKQDFRRFSKVTQIQPQRSTITIPAFLLPVPAWAGASTVLQTYALSNTTWISLRLPIAPFGSYFVAAIRYIESPYVIRYVLWEDDDAVLYFPLYAGERLGPDAVLEIWSINSASSPVLAAAKTLETSILNFPNDSCVSCCDNVTSDQTLVAAAPTIVVPYAYCNPLCSNLCV